MSGAATNCEGRATALRKLKSWSPDTEREEAWARRMWTHRAAGAGGRRSVTDDDLDELRGCMDLGFGFELPAGRGAGRSRLRQTFPALDLFYAVQGGGGGGGGGEGGEGCASGERRSSAAASDASEESPLGSPMSILSPGDTPETVKMRLKQWAQVVALSVRNGC